MQINCQDAEQLIALAGLRGLETVILTNCSWSAVQRESPVL